MLAVLATACSEFDYASRYPRQRASGPPPRVYVVRPGDTLFSVAWRHDLDYQSVARWNGIEPPYTIYPEQRLRLRPSAAPKRQRTARTSSRVATPVAKPQPASKPRPPLPEPISKPNSELVWQWPAKGTITRRFQPDGPGLKGITLQGRLGDPIRAAAAGRVVYSGNGLRGYGNLIIVKHDSVYLTAYGYNRELLVHEGDQVAGGQIIARMGLGPAHQPAAHFEIRRNGKPVDPLRYLPSH
jgi:lipoprotein NlpD